MKAERELMEVNKFSRLDSLGSHSKHVGASNIQNIPRVAKDIRLAKQETVSRDSQVQSDLEKTAVHKKGFRINSKPSQSNVSVGTTTNQTSDATIAYDRQLSSHSKLSQVSTPSQTENLMRHGPALPKPVSRGTITRTKLPAMATTEIAVSSAIQTGRMHAGTPSTPSLSVQTSAHRSPQQTGQQTPSLNASGLSLDGRPNASQDGSVAGSALSRGLGGTVQPVGRLSDVLGLQGGSGFREVSSKREALSEDTSQDGDASMAELQTTGERAGLEVTQKTRILPARAGLPRVGPIAQMKKVKEQFRQGLITGLERDKQAKLAQNQEEGMLANILSARIKQDKDELQVFLEKLGLMKFYDRLWDIGVDSLEGLAHVKVEEWNMMYVPAGTQMKIERELKKMGISSSGQAQDMAIGTDDLEVPQTKTSEPERGLFAKFGIKMRKTEPAQTQNTPTDADSGTQTYFKPIHPIPWQQKPVMASFGGTQTEETDDIPLNVEMDQGPIVRVVEIKSKLPLKGILKGPSIGDSSPQARRNPIATSVSVKKKAKFSTEQDLGAGIDFTQTSAQLPSGSFSFATIGSNNWNLDLVIMGDHDEAIPITDSPKNSKLDKKPQTNQQNTSEATTTAAHQGVMKPNYVQKYQSRKVSCYSCYKTFDELEAMTHRSLPGRFFCGRDCLNDETQKLLTTCSTCFKVLNKAESVPCRNQWTCSEKCFKKANEQLPQTDSQPRSHSNHLTSKAAAELAHQTSVRGLSHPQQSRDRSTGSSAGAADVDLDFDL